MHSWSTFGAKTNHGQIWTHKTHHGLNLGKATTFPLIVYFMPLHKAHIQMTFCPGIPKWESRNSQVGVLKFPNMELMQLWEPITLCADHRSRWVPKQSCNLHRKLFNGMFHVLCTPRNQGNSWLLMIGSQITNLIHGLSFGHNLCFRCPNGSYEPILDI